jgi:cysteine-rich repeat protein
MNRVLVRGILLLVAGLPSVGQAAQPVALPDDGRGRLADGRLASARDATPQWGLATGHRSGRAWRRWLTRRGASWASWDRTTEVPRRILLSGVPAPGVIASAAEAERFGAALLADHLDLLAPGTSAADFVLVTNDLSDGIRTLGWTQHHLGQPVVGGQLSLRFKHDRLVAVGSEAWPDVGSRHAGRGAPRAPADLRRDADAWIAVDVPGRHIGVDTVSTAMWLPVLDTSGLQYREVVEVVVEVDHPRSRWSVYLDASTGEPVARRQTLLFASSTLRYEVPVRSPQSDRNAFPATHTDVAVDGGPQLTDALGVFTFPGPASSVATGLTGPLGAINNAAGANAVAVLPANDGVDTIFAAPDDELVDSQLTTWIHGHLVKEYVRGIAPDLAWLDGQIQMTVNIDDTCNANSDGDAINFFRASAACENTGRIADVVYHEFGHSTHFQSVLAGVGSFDTALSEGVSDYLSATITGDSGLARGFFHDDSPLRELDPVGHEAAWPEDNGEVHFAGLIIGGALWDLRKALIAEYGTELGVAMTDHIYYESTRRAVDIPSMYAEALVVDDDDGNLANGTPHACIINAAYGPHGLVASADGPEQVVLDGSTLQVFASGPSFPDCPVGATAQLEYKPRDDGGAEVQTVDIPTVDGGFAIELPAGEIGEVLNYRVRVTYSSGTQRILPDNQADPWYERFYGEVDELYCTSFADGATDWTLSPGGAAFEVDTPPDLSSVDPTSPAGVDPFVLGTDLGGTGGYGPNTHAVATSPVIELPGGYDAYRLQYQRWLTVEDGFYDQAIVSANGEPVWSNHASASDNSAYLHHRDREWRFHDIDVTEQAASGSLELSLELHTDQGLHFGGWTVDELCIVGFDGAAAVCGNDLLEPGEECDDGNTLDGDGCTATCIDEEMTGADSGGDDGTAGGDDDGFDDTGDDDGFDGTGTGGDREPASDGELVGRGCACTSTPQRRVPRWAWALVLVTIVRRRNHGSRGLSPGAANPLKTGS